MLNKGNCVSLRDELSAVKPTKSTVLTIGVFDGVHLGHRHLLAQVKTLASKLNAASGAVILKNSPQEVLVPGSKISYLTMPYQRVQLMKDFGIAFPCPITFTDEVRNLSPRELVQMLKENFKMTGLVIGPDFAMGKGRQGTEPVIRELGRELGFEVAAAELYKIGDLVVSSTLIRQALSLGDVDHGSRMLGRSYAVTGLVVKGKQRGKTLGFPTANVSYPANQILPQAGIYAGWAVVGDKRHAAAISTGVNPTFGDLTQASLEAYLIDFAGDLYEKTLSVEFVARLRGEVKFATVDELKKQMETDVQQAKSVLSKTP
ncbi:MAG: bifunctional riboflavin kinase/FAD synthetase [Dehalococcoidia bacterium]|nr:bifunctional riboflavin kinase/FAD synthetase [Dehalococcoidia bacterium]